MKKTIFILIFILITLFSYSQDKYPLAIEYYKTQEFEKASVLFEDLYKKQKMKFYFDYYIKCLIELEEFDVAERKIKKEIRKNKSDLSFKIDLGYVYLQKGEKKKANNEYQYVYKNLQSNKNSIVKIGYAFISKKEYEWAEKTYLKGRELVEYSFHNELANLYAIERKNNEMINEYLELLAENNSHYKNVKTRFSYYLDNDHKNEFADLLRKNILIKIQEKQLDIFNELLIWLFIQQKKFNSAFLQAKSLDKRNNENGVRVYKLAELSFENKEYKVANEAYNYVIKKGKHKPYYYKSKFGLITVLYMQVLNGEIKTEKEIQNIENQYLSIINELGVNTRTIDIIVDLAHLQSFYLNKAENAINLLKQAIEIKNLDPLLKGKCEIELGNIFLLTNQPWSAILAFAKAEDINKHNEIGDNAKFNKAKTYFYLGNFKLAKAQFDILKGSTSKLIANNAFEISVLISEAIEEDSIYTPIEMYARADYLYFQNNINSANKTLDSIVKIFPQHSLCDDVYFLKYKIAFYNKNYTAASENLQYIIDNYFWDILGDKALFLLAELYDYQLNDKEKAKELYEKLMFDYTGSIYVTGARNRYRELTE